jgi:hypothetical protein
MSLMDFVVSPPLPPVVAEMKQTSEFGTPMRRGYVIPMIWMVIYEYGVPGGSLTQVLLNYPDLGHLETSPSREKSPW